MAAVNYSRRLEKLEQRADDRAAWVEKNPMTSLEVLKEAFHLAHPNNMNCTEEKKLAAIQGLKTLGLYEEFLASLLSTGGDRLESVERENAELRKRLIEFTGSNTPALTYEMPPEED